MHFEVLLLYVLHGVPPQMWEGCVFCDFLSLSKETTMGGAKLVQVQTLAFMQTSRPGEDGRRPSQVQLRSPPKEFAS